MRKNQHPAAIFCLVVFFLSFTTSVLAATHQLSLNPVRTVFTDKKRAATVRITNPTNHALGYALSIISMRKNNEGKWIEVAEESEEETLIKNMIRFSPRRAVIPPGKRQLVKMMLRKPKDLPAGEYRAWLHLVPMAVVDDEEKIATEKKPETSNIRMDVIVKSNFPIIIQNGNLISEVVAESIKIQSYDNEKNSYLADIVIQKEGEASAFGNIEVQYYKKGANKGRRIGRASEIAVYLHESSKRLSVRLRNISEVELQSGHLEVSFHPMIKDGNRKKYPGKPSILRQFSLPLP